MYLKYVNTVYFVFKYKIHFEFASNTKYIACISNNTYLKYFSTLAVSKCYEPLLLEKPVSLFIYRTNGDFTRLFKQTSCDSRIFAYKIIYVVMHSTSLNMLHDVMLSLLLILLLLNLRSCVLVS